MEANELRIGNLVWNEIQKIPVKVDLKILEEQYHRYKIYKRTGKDIGLWKPIPLTEKWLLNLGFKKAYSAIHDRISIWNKDDFQIEFDFKKIFINGQEMSHIKYVHQLQNIYYDFEQKKLEIKK